MFLAFIYEQGSNGAWNLVQSLTSPASDRFGRSVDMFGDTAIVGAYGFNNSAGIVYIFNKVAPGVWTETHRLSSRQGPDSTFGYSIGIYNETISIGAPFLLGKSLVREIESKPTNLYMFYQILIRPVTYIATDIMQ